MKSNQNKLVKVNNQVLKRTDNIISITNKIVSKTQILSKEDFEWWDSLEDYWKVNFGYFINHIIKLEEKGIIDSNFYSKTIFSAGSDLNKIKVFNPLITKDLNKLLQIERLKIHTDSSIKKSPLKKFINLRELSLSIHNNCDLEFLRNLKKIKKLSLSNFFYYQGNLSNLNLEPLKNFKELIELEIITTGSKIENLDIISENKNLSSLKISDYSDGNNKIKFDNIFFEKLPKLRYLKISNAVFDNYSSINDNLRELSLTSCSAINISIFKKNKVLKKLEITQTKIKEIEFLYSLVSLEFLSVNDNDYIELDRLSNLTKLRVLQLINIEISDITCIKKIKTLDTLSLNNNNISDVSSLEYLTNLRRLELYSNNISNIKPLLKLKKLESLVLGNNPIEKLEIEELRKELPNCKILF